MTNWGELYYAKGGGVWAEWSQRGAKIKGHVVRNGKNLAFVDN